MRKVWPVVLALVGVVLFAFGIGNAVGGVASSVNSVGEPWTAGQPSTQTLAEGGHVIYEQATTPTLGVSDFEIVGPQGPATVSSSTSSTVTLGTTTYVSVVAFTAPVSGEYTITVNGSGQQLAVGPSVAKTLGSAFGWIGAAVLGGLLTLAGVVWLIVVLVAGARHSTPAVVAGQTGGWYPDPQDPAQWRWWDGRQWTEQRAPRQ